MADSHDLAQPSGDDDPFAGLVEGESSGPAGAAAAEPAKGMYASSLLALSGLPPATAEQLAAWLRQEGVASARDVEVNELAGTAVVRVGDHHLGVAFGLADKQFLGATLEVALATDKRPQPVAKPAAAPAPVFRTGP